MLGPGKTIHDCGGVGGLSLTEGLLLVIRACNLGRISCCIQSPAPADLGCTTRRGQAKSISAGRSSHHLVPPPPVRHSDAAVSAAVEASSRVQCHIHLSTTQSPHLSRLSAPRLLFVCSGNDHDISPFLAEVHHSLSHLHHLSNSTGSCLCWL